MIEQVVLSCEALGNVQVVRAEGVEAMNASPRWTLDVLSPDADVDLAGLLSEPASLGLGDPNGGVREVRLQITEASYAGPHRDGHRYRIVLGAMTAPLEKRFGHRMFQDLTAHEIAEKVLQDAGIAASDLSFRLAGQYAKRIYTVQYGETEWAFITRLLADDGINYWFDQKDDGSPVLMFGDAPTSHASIEGDMTLRFEDASGLVAPASSFHSLKRVAEMAHDRAQVLDFDVRQPSVPIEGVAGDGSLEYFEFPANVIHSDAARARARVRLEQLRRFQLRLEGQSSCARLQPGRVVRIDGAADDVFNGGFLIVEVEHHVSQASRNVADGRPYANRVLMVPFDGSRAFRPAVPESPPRVVGMETATVTGPSGEEIHVDDLGCVKVRFPWDRSGIADDKSSRWVRCLQMNMQGSMLLPRMGWEVPVVYVDGNPDRPFVLGRLYNGGAPAPYGLPAKKATSTLQSATSPGDGTTQEIRLADDAGSMEAFIHATKDQTVLVGGTNTVTVSVNETHDVKQSSVLTIKGSQSTTIGASQSVTVGADAGLKIKGARSESIGAMETIGVTGSYNCECNGSYSELVGGLYGLQCNQSNTVVQGAFTQTIGAGMVLTAGLGTNNSVAAARMEQVGGSRSYTAASAYADSVKGVKKVTAGASSDTAGTDVVTNVSGVGSVSVGGDATLSSGDRIAVAAPSITIKVGSTITAKGGATLTIGGKVEVSGGTAKLDTGNALKKSTSEVGG